MYQVIKNDLSNDLMPFDKQVKRTDEPLPNGYTIHIISGSKGTGKTTLVLNLLKRRSSPYYKQFDNIYLISPTAGRDPKMDSLIDELKMDDKFYTELNDENLNEIMSRLVEFNEDFLDRKSVV
jgi:predicted AAA+ superfamily ATPase